MIKYINETSEYLKNKRFEAPVVGIILGTGLGKFTELIENPIEISYNHIPHLSLIHI